MITPECDPTGMKYYPIADGKVAHTIEITKSLLLDVDENGRAIGLEVFPPVLRLPVGSTTAICGPFDVSNVTIVGE